MAGRRRAAARQDESVEPPEGQVTRQTRRSTRRTEAPAAEQRTNTQPETAQRGARRRRQRSLEGASTDDSLKSSGEYESIEPERSSIAPTSEPIEPGDPAAASDVDYSDDSPESKAARIQDMIDFDIPKLSRWCKSMYNALGSMSIPPTSPDDRKRLAGIRKSYSAARRPFASESELYIDSFTLPEDYSPKVRASVRIAICSGNLISLLTNITDIRQGKKDSLHIFQQLDDAFPTLFDHGFRSHLDDADVTFNLAFSIRCRHLALSLVANPSTNLFILAARIFCSERINTAKKAHQALSEGPFRELAEINVDEDTVSREAYQARMNDLVSVLSTDDRIKACQSLNQAYPEDRLLENLWSWAREMFQYFGSGDQQSLQTSSLAESENMLVDGNDSGSDTDAEGYDQLEPQGPSAGFIDGPATLAAVKQSEREASERPTTMPSEQQDAKGKRKATTTKEAILRLDPGKVLSSSHRRHPSGSFPLHDDPRHSPSGSQLAPTKGAVAGRTRSRSTEDDDVSDDFEVNQQLVHESRRVRYQDDTPRLPLKHSRFSSKPRAVSPRAPSSAVAVPREVGERPSRDDPFANSGLRDADLITLSQTAQNNRRANYVFQPRQIRTPWSSADTERLLELIADPTNNCSWSVMEQLGGFEKFRSQQSLRDKARNLKVLYLQSDMVLPAGFDQVALSQKERDAVTKAGRNPDRAESDLDEDGRVINNIWAAY
ncbi:hypothetical protein F5X99DRAFT_382116 [Biscogniauxia marginata]|nr:hypothetical protein F5X99DRAFT_382116 [Biscogniauxia marginata]